MNSAIRVQCFWLKASVREPRHLSTTVVGHPPSLPPPAGVSTVTSLLQGSIVCSDLKENDAVSFHLLDSVVQADPVSHIHTCL